MGTFELMAILCMLYFVARDWEKDHPPSPTPSPGPTVLMLVLFFVVNGVVLLGGGLLLLTGPGGYAWTLTLLGILVPWCVGAARLMNRWDREERLRHPVPPLPPFWLFAAPGPAARGWWRLWRLFLEFAGWADPRAVQELTGALARQRLTPRVARRACPLGHASQQALAAWRRRNSPARPARR